VAHRIAHFVFGVPESQAGVTLRVRDLVEARTEYKLEASEQVLQSFELMGIAREQVQQRALGDAKVRDFAAACEDALLRAAEGCDDAAAALPELPEYTAWCWTPSCWASAAAARSGPRARPSACV
jgi:hypothetical protein